MIYLIVVWVMMAFVCSYVAGQKGRSRGNHFVGGLLFSVVWLLVLIALPTVYEDLDKKQINRQTGVGPAGVIFIAGISMFSGVMMGFLITEEGQSAIERAINEAQAREG